MRTRLTRRGWAVAAVGVAGVGLAATFGPRALNAVVLPAIVALGAALVQVWTVGTPPARRDVPPDDHAGATHPVRLRFETDAPFAARVREGADEGLDVEPAAVETTVGDRPVEFEVTYRERGVRRLGPVAVTARDVLGLAVGERTCEGRSAVVVYPRVHALTPTALEDLRGLASAGRSNDRDEFDRLREYDRGDSLRDVHWKTSAKREDLVVKEFTADNRSQRVQVAAGASEEQADAMAEAVASVVLALLGEGVPVELATPSGTLEAVPGDDRTVLDHLARVGPGRVPIEEADVVVEASNGRVTVRIAGTTRAFETLTSDRIDNQSRTGADGTDDGEGAGDADAAGDEDGGGGDPDAAATDGADGEHTGTEGGNGNEDGNGDGDGDGDDVPADAEVHA
jgi:uncharacterized protein (DUF58 family)